MNKDREPRGLFIVIEGADGAGKSTQYSLLVERFKTEGRPFTTIKFPQYGHPAAYFVERYLKGDYGTAMEVSPKRASLFYALERFDAGFEIRALLEQGTTVLADRYITSNMAINGAKISELSKRLDFYNWISDIEYGILGIPEADLDIILTITPEQAERNIASRVSDGKATRDVVEQDSALLVRTHEVYKELITYFPRQQQEINCMNSDLTAMLPASDIHESIWKLVAEKLA